MELSCTLDISFFVLLKIIVVEFWKYWSKNSLKMGSVYWNFWPSGFKSTDALSKTSVYLKPMWNQWLWIPVGRKLSFLTSFCVELAQVPLLVSDHLCSFRLTRISTEWSVKWQNWRLLWAALWRLATWCYSTPDFNVGNRSCIHGDSLNSDSVLAMFMS
jgi:hypothetical protein